MREITIIEREILGECACAADYNPYCLGKIDKNDDGDGYRLHLQSVAPGSWEIVRNTVCNLETPFPAVIFIGFVKIPGFAKIHCQKSLDNRVHRLKLQEAIDIFSYLVNHSSQPTEQL